MATDLMKKYGLGYEHVPAVDPELTEEELEENRRLELIKNAQVPQSASGGRDLMNLFTPEKRKALISQFTPSKPSSGIAIAAASANEAEKTKNRAFLESQLPSGGEIKAPEREASFGQQFQMARLEKDEDIANYIRDPKNKVIPQGATGGIIKTRNGESIPGYTLANDPNFYPVNIPGASQGDVGYAAGKVLNLENLLGVGANFIPLVGPELSATYRGVKALWPAVKRMAPEVIGSTTGRGVDESIDIARGRQTSEGLPGKLGESALWSGGSATISEGLRATANLGRNYNPDASGAAEFGPAVTARREGRQAYTQAAQDLNMPHPSLGDMGYNKYWQNITSTYEQVTSRGQARALAKKRATVEALQKKIQEDAAYGAVPLDETGRIDYKFLADKISYDTLYDVTRQYEILAKKDLEGKLSSVGMKGGVEPEEGGAAVLQGIYGKGGYEELKTAEIEQLYRQAEEYALEDEAVFNLKGLKKKVEDLTRDIELQDENGEFVKFSTLIEDPRLKHYMEQFTKIHEKQSDYTVEDIIRIRHNLYEMSRPNPQTGTVDINGKAAIELHRIFTDALDNSTSQRANEAWRAANDSFRVKMETLEGFNLGRLKNEGVLGRGEQAYDQLRGNLTRNAVVKLREIMQPQQFDQFQKAYYQDVLSDPVALANRIHKLSPAEKVLIPQEAKDILKKHSLALSRLDQTAAADHLRKLESKIDRVKGIMGEMTSGSAASDVLKPSMARNTLKQLNIPYEAYQIALIENVLQKSKTLDKGVEVINPTAFMAQIKQLKQSGHWDNLKPSQKQLLQSAETVNSFMKNVSDWANQLNIGSILSTKAFESPQKMARSQLEIAVYALRQRLSENPRVVKFFTEGYQREYKSIPWLRAFVSGSTDAIKAMQDKREELPEFEGIRY